MIFWAEGIPSTFCLLVPAVLFSTFLYFVAALHTQARTLVGLVKLLNLLMSRILFTAEPAGGLWIWFSCPPLGLLCRSLLRSALATPEAGDIGVAVVFGAFWFLFDCALVSTAVKDFLWSLFIPSLAYAATSLVDFVGHSSRGLFRNSGPFCHSESSLRCSGLAPLVMRSVMFCPPGIHLHSSTDGDFWISPTLFAIFGLLPARFDCPEDGASVQPAFNCAFHCIF